MKKYILGLLSGITVAGVIGVSASILYQASEIGFTSSDSNWKVNNIEDALDDLYDDKNGSYTDFENKAYWSFDYTGESEEFKVPISGTYKLEVWGAQGGNANTYAGGYGGYSVGVITLSEGSTLYVSVGEKGASDLITTNGVGSYNGGGGSVKYANDNSNYTATGGGATHIATVRGLLKDLVEYKDTGGSNISNEILIVAGGGGGAYYHTNGANYSARGGDAGGFKGTTNCNSNSSFVCAGVGTQTTGGSAGSSGAAGGFGYGGTSTTYSSGGGSGWYGGGSAHHKGTGGGSGYIGSSKLKSNSTIIKHMTCYNCETSNNEETKTQKVTDSTCLSEKPVADNAKIGNGFARITYIGN